MKRLHRSSLTLAAVVFLAASAPLALAQNEGGPPPGPLTSPFELQKITTELSKKRELGWELTITGAKNSEVQLPEGAVFDFEIKSGFKTVYEFSYISGRKSRFTFTVEADAGKSKISDEIPAEGLVRITGNDRLIGYAQGLMLRCRLVYEKQDKDVRDFIDKMEAIFPKSQPWIYSFPDRMFDLGSASDLEKQKSEVQDFFAERITRLVKVDRALNEERQKALAGEAFKNPQTGQFDPKAWQTWIEAEVRDPVRQIQADIQTAPRLMFYAAHAERDLDKYLLDLSRAVAKRSYERSKGLHQKLGLSPDPKDLAPREIDANARRYQSKDLQLIVERLVESQALQLNLE